MPQITRQKPVAATRKPVAKAGSVLSRAFPISEIEDDFIKMMVYGINRIGKTTLACQWPKPLLLIAFEPAKSGGAKSVKKIPGVELLKITNMKDAVKLAAELKDDTTFKTHVLDSVTSLQDLILMQILDLPELMEQNGWGKVSRDDYRERSEQTREALRPFLNLNAHTVLIAKERDHNPPDKDKPSILRGQQLESFFAADLGGATVGWLHDACDYIARLYVEKETKEITTSHKIAGKVHTKTELVETGRNVRRLRTMLHPNYAAGFRSENPKAVPEYINDPTYEKVAKVIRGEMLPAKDAKYLPPSDTFAFWEN